MVLDLEIVGEKWVVPALTTSEDLKEVFQEERCHHPQLLYLGSKSGAWWHMLGVEGQQGTGMIYGKMLEKRARED